MNRVGKIKGEVKELTAEGLTRWRVWFAENDWTDRNRALERDMELGKLNDLAIEALADHPVRPGK